ncbi:hypothetical protein V6N12_023468 [Hibiscus sabdariffa]|uniref:Uncharacterized protein n=1 Tax=Hibiscus sabdariffa TaxID=183260 RepID=A0ABR2FXR8_9ROSI
MFDINTPGSEITERFSQQRGGAVFCSIVMLLGIGVPVVALLSIVEILDKPIVMDQFSVVEILQNPCSLAEIRNAVNLSCLILQLLKMSMKTTLLLHGSIGSSALVKRKRSVHEGTEEGPRPNGRKIVQVYNGPTREEAGHIPEARPASLNRFPTSNAYAKRKFEPLAAHAIRREGAMTTSLLGDIPLP